MDFAPRPHLIEMPMVGGGCESTQVLAAYPKCFILDVLVHFTVRMSVASNQLRRQMRGCITAFEGYIFTKKEALPSFFGDR